MLGVVVAILGALGRAPFVVVIGGIFLLFALVVLMICVAGLLLRRNRTASWKAASDSLVADLRRWGSSNVAELEASQKAQIAAQAPYELWVRTQEAVARKRLAVQTIEAEARATLQLPASANFRRVDLEALQQSTEEVRGQLAWLKEREDRWSALDQAAQARGSDLDKAAAALREMLQQNQFAGEDLDRETERFLQLCESRRQLDRLEAQISTLDAKLEGQEATERIYSSTELEVQNARSSLLRSLQRNSIETDDPSLGFQEFENRCDRADAAHEKRSLADTLAHEIQTLLAAQTLDELKQRHVDYVAEVLSWLAANPSLTGLRTEESPEALQQRLDALGERKAVVGQQLATVEERLRSGEAGQRTLAEVDEDIAEAQGTIAALTFHKLALEAAVEHLTSTTDEHHRNFLPRLNETVGRSLSKLTAGRYSNVLIDHHNLQIKLQVPGRPDPVFPDVLSRGAQEQIYLLLRLGLSELMSSGRERLPLVLDDPLVNYDSERLVRGLDFLAELSAQTQILLFTKDESTAAWFRSQQSTAQAHMMHVL